MWLCFSHLWMCHSVHLKSNYATICHIYLIWRNFCVNMFFHLCSLCNVFFICFQRAQGHCNGKEALRQSLANLKERRNVPLDRSLMWALILTFCSFDSWIRQLECCLIIWIFSVSLSTASSLRTLWAPPSLSARGRLGVRRKSCVSALTPCCCPHGGS